MLVRRAVAAAAALLVSASAFAEVTFDADAGTGFVGKGDVQLAFGWNNDQLQANAADLGFTYQVTEKFEATCTWINPGNNNRSAEVRVKEKTVGLIVDRTVAFTARAKNRQITGFALNGFSGGFESDDVPVVGSVCHGEGKAQGTWTSVVALEGGMTGGLYVTHAGVRHLLPQPTL